MSEYIFQLYFTLPDKIDDPEIYFADLYERGCTDGLLGLANLGKTCFDITWSGDSLGSAIDSALINIRKVPPEAKLEKITFIE